MTTTTTANPRMIAVEVAVGGAIIVAVTATEVVILRGRPPQLTTAAPVMNPVAGVVIAWTVVIISITPIMATVHRGRRRCAPILECNQA